MKNRKAQAALEFLMTYGWAFLVILVMIGALAYFGVLSPKNLMPEKCTATTGFACDEFAIDSTDGTLILTNNLGEAITVTAADVTGDYDAATVVATPTFASGTAIPSGDTVTLTITWVTDIPVAGDKIEVPIDITYTPVGKTLAKEVHVDLFALVQ